MDIRSLAVSLTLSEFTNTSMFNVTDNVVQVWNTLYDAYEDHVNIKDIQTKVIEALIISAIPGIFLLVTIICMCICCQDRVHVPNKPVFQENDINLSTYNWSVFDLAKTAYEPGHTEAVMKLVNKFDYDVNFTMPSSGISLFLCTCLSGDKKLINFMLEKGADVKCTSKDGDSALYLATYGILNSMQPDASVLSDLINAGCDVNAHNNRGYTPLHRAASKANMDVIKCLLYHGADPYQPSNNGIYPIDSAINAGHLEAAELLKIDVNNPHVWELIDPHTPPRISLGLQSPTRRHLMESSRPRSYVGIKSPLTHLTKRHAQKITVNF